MLDHLYRQVGSWIGGPQVEPYSGPLQLFTGARAIIPIVSGALGWCIELGFGSLFILFLLRILLRKQWAASVMFIMIFATAEGFDSESLLLGWIFGALGWGVCLLALVRFGLLATVAGILAYNILSWFPITTQVSAWYSGTGITGLVLLLSLAAYAFHTSLASQPLFGRASLED